jgi:hypothetical protein
MLGTSGAGGGDVDGSGRPSAADRSETPEPAVADDDEEDALVLVFAVVLGVVTLGAATRGLTAVIFKPASIV